MGSQNLIGAGFLDFSEYNFKTSFEEQADWIFWGHGHETGSYSNNWSL